MCPAESKNITNLKKFIEAEYPLIYLESDEEDRVLQNIITVAQTTSGKTPDVYIWSSTQGLVNKSKSLENSKSLINALTYVTRIRENSLFILKDVQHFLNDHVIVRKIRDLYYYLKKNKRYIFFISPEIFLPRELHHEILVYEFLPPDVQELKELLDTYLENAVANNVQVLISPEEKFAFVQGLKGLTYDEAKRAFNRVFLNESIIDISLIEKIYEEKQQYCRKTGVLEFVPPGYDIEDVGGLDELKTWLTKRKIVFKQDSNISETMLPKGILLMGISGCGKSLAVKAVSSLWDLPLFRLDMNLVFSGSFGTPEDSFNRALKLCETLAPMLLWIDEIEMGIGGYETGTSGASARIFASFLTWMQEHESLVFVAATANRVDLLPAEILRKGRFDQVFFVDFPAAEDRMEIFKIHLATRDCDLQIFNYETLANLTQGWNGAEIEQAVVTAIIESQNESRTTTQQDLLVAIGKIVPLSQTMVEQVNQIRKWAHKRALRASSKKD